VCAHAQDAPYIEGQRTLLKLAPERLATLAPEARAFFEEWAKHPPRVRVSRRLEDGQLRGPWPEVTLDMDEAMRSVAKLAELEPEFVICYHGGLFGPGAAARLRESASAGA
jgi:hypothetical protein